MIPKETIEKAERALEAETRNLRIRKSTVENEVNALENKKINIISSINELEQRKILAHDEYKKEYVRLQDIKKEAKSIKDDCAIEIGKVKKEWADLSDEADKVKKDAQGVATGQTELLKKSLALKEERRKITVKQAQLDQQEACLKTEKENQNNREKQLNKTSCAIEERDLLNLKDNENLKKEGERLANIAKSLEDKRREFMKMQSLLEQRSKDLDLKYKELDKEIEETKKLEVLLKDKIKETEESSRRHESAYAGIVKRETELRVKQLQFLKISKEKLTEETLKKLEEEMRKEDNA